MKICKVSGENVKNILSDLLKRSPNQYGDYEKTVRSILNDVRENGDQAMFSYTESFDHCRLDSHQLQVTEEEIQEAYDQVDESLVEVIRKALVNIRSYHEKQKRNSWPKS